MLLRFIQLGEKLLPICDIESPLIPSVDDCIWLLNRDGVRWQYWVKEKHWITGSANKEPILVEIFVSKEA